LTVYKEINSPGRLNSQVIFVLTNSKPLVTKEIFDTIKTVLVHRIIFDYENVAITQILSCDDFRGCG
jgi:hypothetical protein